MQNQISYIMKNFMGFSLSFVLPHRETDSITEACKSISKACTEASIPFEIITVMGNHPTVQRNRSVEKAHGSIIYFVDNDSHISSPSLIRARAIFASDPEIAILGGPVLTPHDNSYLQKTFWLVFSSYLSVGRVSSRHTQRGSLRETDDKELILCNLLVRREALVKLGGFNEKLYPNEENEFIYRAKTAGFKVVYDPGVTVERDQRENVGQFIKQIITYGRGRGEQTRLEPRTFDWIVLIPMVFSIYLSGVLMVGILVGTGIYPRDYPTIKSYLWLTALPLMAYMVLLIVSFVIVCMNNRRVYLLYPLFFIMNHYLYGLGFLKGFFSRKYQSEKKQVYYHISTPRCPTE